jgi:hypothetical protein
MSEPRTLPLDVVLAEIQVWADAYPEDCPTLDGEPIFAPLPPASTETVELQKYRTRASAAMGRHMARCLISRMKELAGAP